MEILAQLTQLKADFAAATDSKAALEAQIAELTGSIASKDVALQTASDALAAKGQEYDDLKAAFDARESHLAAIEAEVEELTTNQRTAEERAIEIAASQGIAPLKVDVAAANSPSGEDVLAEYARLQKVDSVKAGEYFSAHSDSIFGR